MPTELLRSVLAPTPATSHARAAQTKKKSAMSTCMGHSYDAQACCWIRGLHGLAGYGMKHWREQVLNLTLSSASFKAPPPDPEDACTKSVVSNLTDVMMSSMELQGILTDSPGCLDLSLYSARWMPALSA